MKTAFGIIFGLVLAFATATAPPATAATLTASGWTVEEAAGTVVQFPLTATFQKVVTVAKGSFKNFSTGTTATAARVMQFQFRALNTANTEIETDVRFGGCTTGSETDVYRTAKGEWRLPADTTKVCFKPATSVTIRIIYK